MQIEEEILNELRGQYRTSFYSIYLNGTYDEDISKMSKSDQGTLLHEYIHYLQNISTPCGIYMSMMLYNLMYQSLHEIVDNNPISIPVNPNFTPQSISSYRKIMSVFGTKSFENRKCIDWTKEIIVSFSQEIIEGSPIDKASFDVFLTNGNKERIEIGALIVMETMSALYQSFIDSHAQHPDFPYNIIFKYCQKYYPKLASDTRKLICLCYASLFTLCPGVQLMHLIKDYGKLDAIDGYTAFNQFVSNYDAGKKKDGTPRTLVDYVDEMIDKIKEMLSKILFSNLDFLNEIFEPIRLSKQWVPAVSALYDKTPFSLEHFKIMINYVGLPYLHTSKQQYSFPNVGGKTEASTDLLELIALQAIYEYFVSSKDKDKECMLSYMCKSDKYNVNHCKNHPWSQDIQCPFSIVCKALGIDKKTING